MGGSKGEEGKTVRPPYSKIADMEIPEGKK